MRSLWMFTVLLNMPVDKTSFHFHNTVFKCDFMDRASLHRLLFSIFLSFCRRARARARSFSVALSLSFSLRFLFVSFHFVRLFARSVARSFLCFEKDAINEIRSTKFVFGRYKSTANAKESKTMITKKVECMFFSKPPTTSINSIFCFIFFFCKCEHFSVHAVILFHFLIDSFSLKSVKRFHSISVFKQHTFEDVVRILSFFF